MEKHSLFNASRYEEISAYENYISAIRDSETKRRYQGQLEMFLNSEYDHSIPRQQRKQMPEEKLAVLVNEFVRLIKEDPNVGRNIIKRYVVKIKEDVKNKKINSNTSHNRLKPIKMVLRANDIDFSWYLIDKMMPKEKKSEDRAYAKEEIQRMILNCEDIIDRLIITMFAASGFRLEAWDYFTWSDHIEFKNDNGDYKGGALRVYHGDAEEYWTHTTPEVCKLLDVYKNYWIGKFGSKPLPSDPLIAQERMNFPKRLKHKGIMRRVEKVSKKAGLRIRKVEGTDRFEVKLDHGFRKFFNTMLRRAKVYFADKEDMMGHKLGLESHYERYEEQDFERFSEYQKAIPFLTISEEEQTMFALKQKEQELQEEKTAKRQLEKKVDEVKELKEKMSDLEKLKEELKEEFIAEIKNLKELYPSKK